jgi:hypothetical protein
MNGTFRGFVILVFGGLIQPLASLVWSPLGYVWLVLVAVVAFGSAGWIAAGATGAGPRSGPFAAVGGYMLALPLVVMSGAGLPALQLFLTSTTACVVGFVAASARIRTAGIEPTPGSSAAD